MARSKNLPVALIQMSCTADPEANLRVALAHIATAARKGAKLICLPELFRSLYFCQKQNYKSFELAEPIPGPTTEVLAAVSKKHGITLVASLLKNVRVDFITTRPPSLARMGRFSASTEKCIFPTIQASMRSFTSLQEIPAFNRSIPPSVVWGFWCAGISGIPKPPA